MSNVNSYVIDAELKKFKQLIIIKVLFNLDVVVSGVKVVTRDHSPNII